MQPGKECGFETDINVPLIVRGPGVAKKQVSYDVNSHTDLAPTFLSLAHGKLRDDFDGTAINPFAREAAEVHLERATSRTEHVNVEYWGFALSEGDYDQKMYWNNTYKALRLIGGDYNLYYSVWCSGEHQLYDLNVSANFRLTSSLLLTPHRMTSMNSTIYTPADFIPPPSTSHQPHLSPLVTCRPSKDVRQN